MTEPNPQTWVVPQDLMEVLRGVDCCVCHLPITDDPTQVVNHRFGGRGWDGEFRKGSVWHSACGPLDMLLDDTGNPLLDRRIPEHEVPS